MTWQYYYYLHFGLFQFYIKNNNPFISLAQKDQIS